ncbi:MAG: ATP-binding cassette domain-containing protein, partial [Fimbriimonadales bacterium]
LVRMMIGRNIDTASVRAIRTDPGEVLLRVEGLTSPLRFADVSFEVRAGEVVGFAGLVGAGRSEVAQAVFGLDPRATGRVTIGGEEPARRSPAGMMRLGVGLVPEDRKRQGLVLGMTARENISLPSLPRLSKAGFVERDREYDLARRFFEAMAVKAPHVDAPSAGLSGGNQQKLVMAKWLAADCRVLILDEPTRGVDVGTKSEIHHIIRRLAAEGRAVVVISSELPELLTVSDRILAMRNGRIVGELPAEGATEEALMRLMTGVEAAVSA